MTQKLSSWGLDFVSLCVSKALQNLEIPGIHVFNQPINSYVIEIFSIHGLYVSKWLRGILFASRSNIYSQKPFSLRHPYPKPQLASALYNKKKRDVTLNLVLEYSALFGVDYFYIVLFFA